MEAPDKIYIDYPKNYFWFRIKDKNSIEYIRTDVFIKKACKWLNTHSEDYMSEDEELKRIGRLYNYLEKDLLIEDFKKYMKGE